ncbi:MAG: sigma-70 family RNA polymerase sigma factor [Anaerolineales bacterium]|nr:sigma-70 family RNA polymerase sigma factor [Anaerolineales bacterium]
MASSDEFLLTQYKQGNARAFRELVERYTPPIYNLAYRFLRDSMEAENVTQETFLRVIASLERIRLDIPFKPYLFRVAVNLCHDLARKKRPALFSDLDTRDDATVETLADDAPALWEQIADAELRARVNTALGDLPAPYQTALVLRYVEEFSYEEIAHALNLPLNTVRTHLRRAKQQLRLKLQEA